MDERHFSAAEQKGIEAAIDCVSEQIRQKTDWTKMRGRKYPVTLPYREIVDSSRYAAGLKAMPSDLKKITATATRTPSWFLKTFYRKRGKADKRCVQSDITVLFITAAKRRVTGCLYFFRLGAFFCRLAALTRLGARTENASTARHCSRIPYDNVPVYLRGDCFYCLCPDTHVRIFSP